MDCAAVTFLEYLLICGADKGLSEALKPYSNRTVIQTQTNKLMEFRLLSTTVTSGAKILAKNEL